jgi:hypothetical protein
MKVAVSFTGPGALEWLHKRFGSPHPRILSANPPLADGVWLELGDLATGDVTLGVEIPDTATTVSAIRSALILAEATTDDVLHNTAALRVEVER